MYISDFLQTDVHVCLFVLVVVCACVRARARARARVCGMNIAVS
jgi:predicted membrane-bound mannosyltransferase